ncbi:MAG TPA: hypothetical protein VNQ90_08885 [Chthoniobacteraceae bacterium]|nr:hypothetical protein [Chthoniobacteraceae bacterium]
MRTKASPSAGVSLLGVLISIAIIAALAFLLFPVFDHAAQRAKGAKCLQNLRQLHVALHTHASEHQGYFPKTQDGTFDSEGNWTASNWQKTLGDGGYMEYDKESKNTFTPERFIMYCPGSVVRFDTGKCQPHLGHYGINRAIVGLMREDGKNTPPTPLSRIQFPSRKLLLFDSGYLTLTSGFLDNPTPPGNYIPGLSTNQKVAWPSATHREATIKRDALEGRHGRRVNILMVDGHVESWSPEDLLKDKTIWPP